MSVGWVWRWIGWALLPLILCSSIARADVRLDDALERFHAADYVAAIELVKRALAEQPDDASLHFHLGWFLHYLCYDSVPLTGFDSSLSDEVLVHLQRAVELDPGLGDAFYFIGAEYGARAHAQLQRSDAESARAEYREGREAGGYPDWLLEYGRNTLDSLAPDAILVTGGDADANPIQFLQWVDGHRPDVTVIPLALLERPWFVSHLKRGVEGLVVPAPISWSEAQIQAMRPYKWKKNAVHIPIPEAVRATYGTDAESLVWELTPDLRGDGPDRLSAGRAALADILVTNAWARPVYFSTGCPPSAWSGLTSYLQQTGMAMHVLPVEAPLAVDAEPTRRILLDASRFAALVTLPATEMPRASTLLHNYRSCLLRLVHHHLQQGERQLAATALAAMRRNVPADLLPVAEHHSAVIEALDRALQ